MNKQFPHQPQGEANSSKRIEREAMAWITRLSNDTAGEQAYLDFALWLEADPAHASAYDQAEALWLDLGCVKYAPEESTHSGEALTNQPHPDSAELTLSLPLWQQGRAVFAAASIAVAIAVTAMLGLQQPESVLFEQALQTDIGGQASESLPDGSKLMLNTNTELSVRYTDTAREIMLLKGEAFFSVAKDENRPFVVNLPDGAVTAVGTAFNIEIEPQQTLVTVTEGVIRVNEHNDRAQHADVLTARQGDQIEINPVDGMSRSRVHDVNDFTAWQQNDLVFRKARLATVISELNRYTERKIKIADRRLALRSVSGIFKLDKPMETLKAIESSLGLSSKQQDQIILLYEQG